VTVKSEQSDGRWWRVIKSVEFATEKPSEAMGDAYVPEGAGVVDFDFDFAEF